jgi:transcription initiation factor TFIIIB Brf1 subunit/transcription initiation factor TFIIB
MNLKRNYLSYELPVLEESFNDILNYSISSNQSINELGSYISFKNSTMDQRLRKIQNVYIMSSNKFLKAKHILLDACHILNLPKISINYGIEICKKIIQKINISISALPNIVGIALYISSQENIYSRPLTFKEISMALRKLGHRVSFKSLSKTYRKIQYFIEIKNKIRKSEDYIQPLIDKIVRDEKIRKKIESKWDLPNYIQKLKETSNDILKIFNSKARGGRSPYVFAISSLYVAEHYISKKEGKKPCFTQKILAKIAGVGEYSIRENSSYIKKVLMNINSTSI